MRILITSSEAVPFSKTGGLADVASALPKALERAGHTVWLVIPYYPRIHRQEANAPPVRTTGERIEILMGAKPVVAEVLESQLPGSGVRVLLIDQASYYGRDGLYVDPETGTDYRDNCERFVFLSRTVLETARRLDLRPDVLHANDWQTGLVPALLKVEYRRRVPGFERAASVFTIHNMAFQGLFWHWDMLLTGLDWKYFNWRQMEYFGHLNLLKTGIVFSEMITAVSPAYAREIQTPEFGYGLNGVLSSRRESLAGILNGVDEDEWNPRTDAWLPRSYSLDDWRAGKAECKRALQQELGLPVRGDAPLFGMVSRMTDQKGFDLLEDTLDVLLQGNLQMVFLGTGEPRYERLLTDLADQFPDKLAAVIGFDTGLAHRIEGGADACLMPSRFEPCGLSQMYSQMYGTVPIVHSVGGLADTVVDASYANLENATATGFCFTQYTAEAFTQTVGRAMEMYRAARTWGQLVETGMHQDWSWRHSADEYVQVYERAAAKAGGMKDEG